MSDQNSVLVLDYGVGNMLSVRRALESCGAAVEMTDQPAALRDARRVVLPGVGSFGDCMTELAARGLTDAILEYVDSGRPLLGICVGMQMLFEVGEEFGDTPGLGILGGRVVRIPAEGRDGGPHKVPHIGWNALVPPAGDVSWSGTVLDAVEPGQTAYFVHSFTAQPTDDAVRLADADYDGVRISAAVRRDNVSGVQFHPEKSGRNGLSILRTFVDVT